MYIKSCASKKRLNENKPISNNIKTKYTYKGLINLQNFHAYHLI